MSKKVLSIVLALVLALSCFAVSAFAIGELGYEDEDSTYYQKWSLSEAAQDADGKWYVDVSLETDYKVGTMQFALELTNGIKILDVVAGDAITEDYNADIAFDTEGKTNIVAIIPNPTEDAAEGLDLSAGGVVCTVYFEVADGTSGTAQIVDDAKSKTNSGGTLFAARLSDDVIVTSTAIVGQITTIETDARNIGAVAAPKYTVSFDANGGSGAIADVVMEAGDYVLPECTFTAPAGTEFKAWSVNGTECAPGESIAVSADTVVKAVWANLPAELVKTDAAEAGVIIDRTHTFGGAYTGVVFGFTQAANNTFKNKTYITNNLKASNGGSLSIKTSNGKTPNIGNYGTGTVITVENADGSVAETFVVVIFGDVDCNGLINANDTNLVREVVAKTKTLASNSVQTMAANANLVANPPAIMHIVNANDTNAIRNHVSGTKCDQAALAAKMVTLTGFYK